MGVILYETFGKYEDRVVMYRDCYNCELCNDVVVYIGIDKFHHPFCQKCQDELTKGIGMSTKFRKMYQKYLEQKVNKH